MIDDVSLSELIQQQIQSAVTAKVEQLANDRAMIADLEKRTVEIVQQRITGKFANIESVPDLIKTVERSVDQLFQQGRIPGIADFVDATAIEIAIDNAIQQLVKTTIDSLILDPAWIEKIENIVNSSMTAKFSRALSQADMSQLMKQHIDSGIERWQSRLRENFTTQGICDQATATQLTVSDGVVIVEEELATNQLSVHKDADIMGTLVVNNLVLKGKINTDNHSWAELANSISATVLDSVIEQWTQNLVDSVFERTSRSGIDFESITVNGVKLVDGNALGNFVTETNIQKTGTLRDLTVSGPVRLADTATVKNRRVGINTQDPEMALSIWDEEVAVIVGKLSDKKAFVGTARAQDLSIGVNRKAAININTDGLTTIHQLRVDRFRIGHAAEVPGYSGTRGDLVFNNDPKPNTPFAWVCLGSFKWQPLRSAE
jgi:hypothetical protein